MLYLSRLKHSLRRGSPTEGGPEPGSALIPDGTGNENALLGNLS